MSNLSVVSGRGLAVPQPGMSDPGPTGRFGEFGGRYVPESLVPACQEVESAFRSARADPEFRRMIDENVNGYVLDGLYTDEVMLKAQAEPAENLLPVRIGERHIVEFDGGALPDQGRCLGMVPQLVRYQQGGKRLGEPSHVLGYVDERHGEVARRMQDGEP